MMSYCEPNFEFLFLLSFAATLLERLLAEPTEFDAALHLI